MYSASFIIHVISGMMVYSLQERVCRCECPLITSDGSIHFPFNLPFYVFLLKFYIHNSISLIVLEAFAVLNAIHTNIFYTKQFNLEEITKNSNINITILAEENSG